ncbi:MAG: nucleoside hydrolase [Thermodesulfobacteriota bacterium]
MSKNVLIDTDPGVDDALALLLALHTGELAVKAITTVCGNVDVDTATSNLCTVLSLLPGPHPVLAKGANRPLVRKPFFADHVHGANGLGGTSPVQGAAATAAMADREAAEEIVHQINSSFEPMTLITLGPLTNIVLALERDPKLADNVAELVMMGGSFLGPGNITPAAEFNIFADPEAADRVFRSGLPLTAVGLDVTMQVRLSRQTINAWVQDSNSPARRKVQEWTEHSLRFMQDLDGEASIPLHDPLAVLVAMDPDLVTRQRMHVTVEATGRITRGMTLADRRPILDKWKEQPNVQVCTRVNSELSLKRFLEGIP